MKKMKFKGLISLLVGGLLCAFFLNSVHTGSAHNKKAKMKLLAPDFQSKKGKKLNDFTLIDINGKSVKLSQFSSIDVLVINIWSQGCPVCKEEIPSLTALDRKLSKVDGVELLTIAIADGWEEVSSYFPQGTNLRILFDPDDKVGAGVFKTTKYPETFVLDRQRRIVARFDGARAWHQDSFIDYIKTFI